MYVYVSVMWISFVYVSAEVQSILWSQTWVSWVILRAFQTFIHLNCVLCGWLGWWMKSLSFRVCRAWLTRLWRRSKLVREQPGSTKGTAFLLTASIMVMKFVRKWDGMLGGKRAGYRKHLAPMEAKTIARKTEVLIFSIHFWILIIVNFYILDNCK